jgi:hypothetical protein
MNKIDTYFTTNYKWIEKTALTLTSKINKRYLAHELITNCYLYIINLDTEKMDDNKIKSIVINYMKMQVIWSKTTLKKAILKDNIKPENVVLYTNQVDDSRSEEELIEELLEEEFLIQNKINYIHKWLLQAKPEDRLLFDIVYNQGYDTSGKLAKHSGLSRTTCYTMMSKLKQKIVKAYNEHNEHNK